MAVTKDKFGVPIEGARLGILQPKLKYRFRVIVVGMGAAGDELTRTFTSNIVSVTRPTFTVDEVEVHSYNSRAYIAGKHQWEAINLSLRDDITNQVSSLVGQQIQKQFNHFEQTTAVSGGDYKFDMLIQVLDGTNAEPTEQWELEGCMLQQVNYSDHAYDASEIVQLDLSIRYDNAVHVAGPNSLGGKVAAGDPFPLADGLPASPGTGV